MQAVIQTYLQRTRQSLAIGIGTMSRPEFSTGSGSGSGSVPVQKTMMELTTQARVVLIKEVLPDRMLESYEEPEVPSSLEDSRAKGLVNLSEVSEGLPDDDEPSVKKVSGCGPAEAAAVQADLIEEDIRPGERHNSPSIRRTRKC